MKQPMTAKEIDVFDAFAATYIAYTGCTAERAYEVASRTIAARRAALIADAHIGKWHGDTLWHCKCDQFDPGVDYCEACHTRRPEVVQKSQERTCDTCKYEHETPDTDPCRECDGLTHWRAAP